MMPPFGYVFDGIEKSDAIYRASLRAPVQRGKAGAQLWTAVDAIDLAVAPHPIQERVAPR